MNINMYKLCENMVKVIYKIYNTQLQMLCKNWTYLKFKQCLSLQVISKFFYWVMKSFIHENEHKWWKGCFFQQNNNEKERQNIPKEHENIFLNFLFKKYTLLNYFILVFLKNKT